MAATSRSAEAPGAAALVGAPGTGRGPLQGHATPLPHRRAVSAACFAGETPIAQRLPRGPAAPAVLRFPPSQTPALTRRYGRQEGQRKGPDTGSVFRRAPEATGRWGSFAARPGEALGSVGTTEALSKRHVPAPAAAPSPPPRPHRQQRPPGGAAPPQTPPTPEGRGRAPGRSRLRSLPRPAPSLPLGPRHSLSADGSDGSPPGSQWAPCVWRGER